MDGRREHTVTEAFVSIANAMVDGHDILDLYIGLTFDCARILDVASAGLLLADARGVLQVVAASAERTRDLELFMLQAAEGPCLDCYRSAAPVLVPDLALEQARWPRFAPVAVEAGFVAVHAVPMRLRDTTLGPLGLFGSRVGALGREDLELAQALAHVATVALVAGRAAVDRQTINTQLQTALDSRVVLEQAKGTLAQLGDLDVDQAFAALRRFSRDHNRKLLDIAQSVVTRGPLGAAVLAHARAKGVLPAAPPDPRPTDPAPDDAVAS
jgi:hypothetical protein